MAAGGRHWLYGHQCRRAVLHCGRAKRCGTTCCIQRHGASLVMEQIARPLPRATGGSRSAIAGCADSRRNRRPESQFQRALGKAAKCAARSPHLLSIPPPGRWTWSNENGGRGFGPTSGGRQTHQRGGRGPLGLQHKLSPASIFRPMPPPIRPKFRTLPDAPCGSGAQRMWADGGIGSDRLPLIGIISNQFATAARKQVIETSSTPRPRKPRRQISKMQDSKSLPTANVALSATTGVC